MNSIRNYQPEIMGVVVGVGILNLWYLSSIAVDEEVIPRSYDYFIRVLTVAIGGFIGAFSAFKLKQLEETASDNTRKKNALNAALFVIIRQINAIDCIKRDFAKYDTSFKLAISMPAFKPPSYSDLKQDISSLSFLIEEGEPDVLMSLTIEQERFEQAMHAIEIRNNFYVSELQPALSHYSLNGKPLPLSEFEEKLGERLFQGAIGGAQTMYDLVNNSESSLDTAYKELRGIAKMLFPGNKFVAWQKQ